MQISQIISQTLFLWSLSTNYNFGADTPQLFTFCKLSSTSTTGWLAWIQNVKDQRFGKTPPNGIIRLSEHQRKLYFALNLSTPRKSQTFSWTLNFYKGTKYQEMVCGSKMRKYCWQYFAPWDHQAISEYQSQWRDFAMNLWTPRKSQKITVPLNL